VRPRWPAAALVASSVLYSSWVLGPWLNPRLSVTFSLASDLAAKDQPWHLLFQFGDVAAGALAVAAAARMLGSGRRYRRWRWHRIGRAERAAWIMLAVFGVATICDGSLTAMPCAASLDPGCPGNVTQGLGPAISDPHTISSAFAVIGGLGSAFAFWLASAPETADRTWTAGLLVGGVATNIILLFELVRAGEFQGVWQRLQLVSLAAWLVYAAVRTQRRDDPAAPSPGFAAGEVDDVRLAAGHLDRQDGHRADRRA